MTGVFGCDELTWSAITAIATSLAAIGAVIAACIALYQVRLMRKQMDDASRAYVVVSVRHSEIGVSMIDLVIENVGASAGRDVTIEMDPPIVSTRDTNSHKIGDARVFREPIAMLPPHYALPAILFERAAERTRSSLPKAHTATVKYTTNGRSYRDIFVLDLVACLGTTTAERYGVHHSVVALRNIHTVLSNSGLLREPGARVTVEDYDHWVQRKDAEEEAFMTSEMEARAQDEERLRKLAEKTPPSEPTGPRKSEWEGKQGASDQHRGCPASRTAARGDRPRDTLRRFWPVHDKARCTTSHEHGITTRGRSRRPDSRWGRCDGRAHHGQWGLSRASSVVGFSLMFIVIAFHRNGEPPNTVRHWMIRIVYGIVLGLTLCIALAYWFQGALLPPGVPQDARAGEVLDALLFWAFPLAIAVGTTCEPMVERALDRLRS